MLKAPKSQKKCGCEACCLRRLPVPPGRADLICFSPSDIFELNPRPPKEPACPFLSTAARIAERSLRRLFSTAVRWSSASTVPASAWTSCFQSLPFRVFREKRRPPVSRRVLAPAAPRGAECAKSSTVAGSCLPVVENWGDLALRSWTGGNFRIQPLTFSL